MEGHLTIMSIALNSVRALHETPVPRLIKLRRDWKKGRLQSLRVAETRALRDHQEGSLP